MYIIRKLISYIFVFSVIFIFCFSNISLAATPKLVSKLTNGFEDIESWAIKIATPAAAVAVASGVFMKKFSFGDEEKIRTSKKIIRGSLFSYGFLLAIDLILAAIKTLVG